jgi:hypothetical protein
MTEGEDADIDCFSGESEQSYNDVQQSDNQSSFSHEAIAGAASFGAFKIFEDRQRSEGMFSCHVFVFCSVSSPKLIAIAQSLFQS